MSKFRFQKSSFIAGQISPTAQGRTDLPMYPHACKTLKNVIPILSGGVYRRPGTLWEDTFLADIDAYPRLIPFVVSQQEPYMLAFWRTRVGSGSGVDCIRPTGTFYGTTVITAIGHTVTAHAHEYAFDSSTGFEEFDQIQYAQSVDVMTLVHPNHKPKKIYRLGTDSFEIADFDTDLSAGLGFPSLKTGVALRDAWPYRDQNTSATTLSINTSSVGTGRVVTASLPLFNVKHVGAIFKSDDGTGVIGAFQVTAFTSSTQVTVEVLVALGTTAARLTWWESAWSDYRGWPRTVAYYQQRICYGGTATDRDSIWLSQSNNFDVMSVAKLLQSKSPGDGVTTGPTGSQPFTIGISSQQLNIIQWLSPDKSLAVGTLGDEFIIESDGSAAGFSSNTAKVTPQSHYGSSFHPAVREGDELIFSQASDDELKSLIFNLLQNTYTAEPIQLLFDDYPRPNPDNRRRHYRHFTWDESRKTLWCIDTAGNLFGMTRDRTQQITSWHTHEMGGFDSTVVDDTEDTGTLCAGAVMSVAIAPNPALGFNDVWLVVRRKINAGWRWDIERFMGRGISSESVESPQLSDSGNYFTDSSVSGPNNFLAGTTEDFSFKAVDGFDHLLGETVVGTAYKIDGRGIFFLNETVAGSTGTGSVIIPIPEERPPSYETESYVLAYGYGFDSVVEPVRPDIGSQIGSAQAAIKRIHRATVRYYRTLSSKIGASADLLETVIFREGSTPMGESPELFTGDKGVDLESDYDKDGYIYLLQDQPLPFCVVSISAEGMTYDG